MTAFASQLFAHVLRHSFSAWLLVSALAVMLPVTWQWLQLPADLSGWLGSYGQWLSLPWLTVLLLVVVVVTARQRNMPQDMSHTLYSAAYRASPDAVGITSIKDGRFIDVNPALCNMLGLPREQIIGRTNAELQVYATPEERVRLLDELASKGQVHRLRILCQSHGEIVPGTISAVLVEFDNEPCMFFIFHDMRDYEKAVDQLHSANRLLQQAGHLAQLGAWEDRRGQGLVYWSDVCYDIHGVPRNSPLPRDYLSTFVAPEHREHMRRQLQQCLRVNKAWNIDMQIIRTDGRKLWVRSHGEAVQDDNGRIIAMRGVMQDIDAYKRQEESIREREALLAVTLEAATLGRWDWDLLHGSITGDSFWHKLNGLEIKPAYLSPAGQKRWHWTEIMEPHDVARCNAELQRHIDHPEDGPFDITWQRPGPAGQPRWLRSIGKIVSYDLHGRAMRMLGVCLDVTEQQEQKNTLRQLAHFDTLTGLANRVELAARLNDALQSSRQSTQLMGIAYLDLDGFKPINDRLGHAAGDRLLVLVAKRLQHTMRSNDCAARFGGDEFVLLLNPLNSRAECEAMLQRIMHSISRPYALDGEQVLVTASIGYTLSPDDSSDADTLIRHADQAMYQAKQSGRNRIEAFDANEDRSQRENHIKGQRILQGLHHHEFVLHVQPKVDMQSGQVIGVEALARWQHPQQGLLTPQHFLPHIEGGELELAFGQWSIMQALDILEDFQQQGLSLPVAVNLSPTHLQHSHFTQWMASQLQAHPRIPPRLLDLEITENAALHDMQKMSRVLKALRALGLNISLDDFGTGYSSLTYLSKLPLDSLKIDRSFVCDMLTDRAHRAIVHGVITMASSFGCKVIAEGVESHEQCACLSDMGCHWAQGFYFARPMAVEDFYRWLQTREQTSQPQLAS